MASINTTKKVFLSIVLIINSFSQLNAIPFSPWWGHRYKFSPWWGRHYNLRSCRLNKIFQFGDSISDVGNLIREPVGEHMMFSKLPYGETFFHKPTGRNSNGLLMIDFIAWAVGVPFINPYKDSDANFENGVNFAVAGATALSTQSLKEKNLFYPVADSLDVQVDWFATYLASICNSDTDCIGKLKDSLFMLGEIGGNDYNYAFSVGRTIDEVKTTIVPDVVQAIINGARRTIQLGAPRVVIPGNFPIGCLPIYLTNFKTNNSADYDELHCHKGLNNFAAYHNDYLREAIEELKKEGHSATIVYADYYNAFMWMLRHAPYLGFDLTSLQKACCGSGGDYNFDFGRMCGDAGVPVCPNPDRYISWDGIHLTQKAYAIMTAWLVKINIFPNIRC